MRADISLEYDDAATAEAIASAVSPDNWKTPETMSIRTVKNQNRVVTTIVHEGKFSTFASTIDDLMSAISVAEKTVSAIKELQKK